MNALEALDRLRTLRSRVATLEKAYEYFNDYRMIEERYDADQMRNEYSVELETLEERLSGITIQA